MLLVSYVLFATGSGICGVGWSMMLVIAGRPIAGFGGAGMTVIVAVLITDMVPMIEVASWRSSVNIIATTGRMAGGSLGGRLADLIGWRWSFLGKSQFLRAKFLISHVSRTIYSLNPHVLSVDCRRGTI